jgi:hypothetical protein
MRGTYLNRANFWTSLCTGKSFVTKFDKILFGPLFGRLFQKASGHTAQNGLDIASRCSNFCWAKLNHRTLLSIPQKFGNDCQHCSGKRKHACSFFQRMFLKLAFIYPENVSKTRVRNFFRQFFSNNFFGQFSNFQASLNPRANASSCFCIRLWFIGLRAVEKLASQVFI